MDGQQVAGTILAVLKKHGVSDDDAQTVLGIVAQKIVDLAKAEKLAKATARGITVDELDGLERGKAMGAKLNERMGYGRKGAR